MSYSETVWEHFNRPRHAGKLEAADVEGHAGGKRAGPFMRFTATLEGDTIGDIRFETHGCAPAVAAGSLLSEAIRGKSLNEAATWNEKRLIEELGGLPPGKLHCATLAIEALDDLLLHLIQEYKNRTRL